MGTGYVRNDTANNIADGNVINAADLDGEFDAVEAAFNSSTGHTHDGTAAEGGAITVLGPSQEFIATATEVKPSSNAGLSLGTSLLEFNDLYASGTATLGSILIDNGGTIGSDSDADAITISSGGNVTFSQTATVDIESATTNAVINTLNLKAQSSGTPAVGIGTGMQFQVETAAGNVETGGAIRVITTGLTPTDEEVDLVFYSMQNGSLTEAFRYDSINDLLNVSGSIQIPSGDALQSINTINISADYDASGAGVVNLKTQDILRVSVRNNGNVQFYEDTGSTISMYWDAVNDRLDFSDNVRAVFGDSDDLQIYHNGTNSYISDAGAGQLIFTSNGSGITFDEETVKITSTSASTTLTIESTNDGAADGPIINLRRNSASPAADDDIGRIDFTGNNSVGTNIVYGRIEAYIEDPTSTTEDGRIRLLVESDGSSLSFMDLDASQGGADGRIMFNAGNSDIDFVVRGESETELLYTDGSTNRIGIGTSTPDTRLHISSTIADQLTLEAESTTIGPNLIFKNTDGNLARIASQETNTLRFDIGPSDTEAMRIDDSGRLLIGVQSGNSVGGVNAALQVAGTGGTTSSMTLQRYQDTASGSIIVLHKSRGTSKGSQGLVADNDQIGRIDFSASDGVDAATNIAGMEARVDMGASGTAAADTLGGRIIWSTNSGTLGAGPSDRMSLTAAGQLIIGAGTATDPDANVLLELASNNGGRAGTSPLNTLRFRDTDTAVVADQPFGRIEWMTSDTSSGSKNVGAYIEALARDTTPDTELVFATSQGAVLAEAMRINKFGNVIFNHTEEQTLGGAVVPYVQVAGIDSNGSSLGLVRHQNTSTGPNLLFSKSRVSTKGDTTVLLNGDQMGRLIFSGADGTDLQTTGASIEAEVDGVPGSNDMPGRIVFSTTANGESSPTERMRIDSDGNVGIGGDPSSSRLRVFGATPYIDIQDTTSGTWDQEDVFSGIRFRTSDPDVGGSGQTHAYIKAVHTREGTGHDNPDAGIVFGTSQGATPTAIERMRITNGGLVGINETNPTAPLHITRNDNSELIRLECTDGDATEGPQMHLYRNSATPAQGDDLAVIKFKGNNSNGSEINYIETGAFITDSTAGTEDASYRILIQKDGTQVNAFNVSAEEVVVNQNSNDIDFRVESDNRVNALFVRGSNGSVILGNNSTITSTPTLSVRAGSTGTSFELSRSTTTGSATLVNFYSNVGGSDTVQHHFEANGDLEIQGTLTQSSDQRLKQDIVDSGSQWDDIKAVQVRKYRKIWDVEQYGDDADVLLGVVAQELEASGMGGLVKTRINEEDPDDDLKSVKYSILYMKAVKALQEAMERIETLETEQAAIKARLDALEN